MKNEKIDELMNELGTHLNVIFLSVSLKQEKLMHQPITDAIGVFGELKDALKGLT